MKGKGWDHRGNKILSRQMRGRHCNGVTKTFLRILPRHLQMSYVSSHSCLTFLSLSRVYYGDNNTSLLACRKNGMRSHVGQSGFWQETEDVPQEGSGREFYKGVFTSLGAEFHPTPQGLCSHLGLLAGGAVPTPGSPGPT